MQTPDGCNFWRHDTYAHANTHARKDCFLLGGTDRTFPCLSWTQQTQRPAFNPPSGLSCWEPGVIVRTWSSCSGHTGARCTHSSGGRDTRGTTRAI